MSKSGAKLIEAAQEAVSIAKGEQPAGRIHVNGFAYVPEDRWEGIETAPKDGRPFMVWAEGYKWPEVVRWFAYDAAEAEEVGEDGYWHFAEEVLQDVCDSPDLMGEYTHWMPLPSPPASRGE